ARKIRIAKAIGRLIGARRLFTRGQEDGMFPPNEVATIVAQPRLTLAHLVPDPTERVVGEELDDVARREELVPDRQLTTVPWRRRFATHALALGWIVVVLVDPTNRLVFTPEGGEVLGVD